MLLRSLVAAVIGLSAQSARADISEIQLSARPELVLLDRHGDLNYGFGLGARAAYGLSDLIGLEGSLACDRLGAITHAGVEIDRRTGSVVYDATRCTLGPAVALRFGAQVVGSVAAGLAYRWEHDSHRDFVSTNKVLLEQLGDTDHHAALGTLRGSLELRPWDFLAAGVDVGARVAVVGAALELDLSIALVVSFFMYP